MNKLSETVFAAQSTIFIALLIFVILYHHFSKVKIGTIEFEKSTEHRSIDYISKPTSSSPEFER